MYRVMIIDDEPYGIELLRISLDWQELGFCLAAECSDADEALQRLAEIAPDVVITDIRMPGMDGFSLIDRIRSSSSREIKVVIMSAYAEPVYAQRALRIGVHHFLVKPVIQEEAQAVMREIRQELDNLNRQVSQRKLSDELVASELLRSIKYGRYEDYYQKKFQELFHFDCDHSRWRYLIIKSGTSEPAIQDPEESETGKNHKWLALERVIRQDPALFLVAKQERRWELLINPVIYDQLGQDMPTMLKKICDTIQSIDSDRFYLAVGEEVASLREIVRSFDSAENTLDFCFYLGLSRIVFSEEADEHIHISGDDEIQAIDQIAAALEIFDQTALTAILARSFQGFRAKKSQVSKVQAFVNAIVFQSIKTVRGLGGDASLLHKQYLSLGLARLELMGVLETEQKTGSYCRFCCNIFLRLNEMQAKDTLSDVRRLIEDRFDSEIRIKELAGQFKMHPAYLGQLFQHKFGLSIHQYLHQVRIGHAMTLIRDSDKSFSEIAADVGYKDYNAFSLSFSRYTGMNPSQYKKMPDSDQPGGI